MFFFLFPAPASSRPRGAGEHAIGAGARAPERAGRAMLRQAPPRPRPTAAPVSAGVSVRARPVHTATAELKRRGSSGAWGRRRCQRPGTPASPLFRVARPQTPRGRMGTVFSP